MRAQCDRCGATTSTQTRHWIAPEAGTMRRAPAPETQFAPPVGAHSRALFPWAWLLVGLLIAPVFAFVPLLRSIGWFFGAIAHEIGHTAVAWFLGSPAFPAIALNHNAATHSFEPMLIMQLAVGLSLGGFAYLLLAKRTSPTHGGFAAAGAIACYFIIANTGLGETLFLLGGHGAELMIGSVFLFRGMTGISTAHTADRALAAVMGAYLIGGNFLLTLGIAFSDKAQREYRANQSFGIENDYARLATDWGISLGAVGFLATATVLAFAAGVCALVQYILVKHRV